MTVGRHARAGALLLAVVVLVGLGSAGSPLAELTPPAQTQAVTGPANDTAPVMLILDASGSMNDADASGGTKLEAAKSALYAVIDSLPAAAEVGLVVYGAGAAGGKKDGCADVRTVFPADTVDKAEMTKAVKGIDAGGWTPIGDALRHTARELPRDGRRSIVLVSDGVQTCGPPSACDAASELSSVGIELIMHTVGFGADDDAREELRCIARTAGGRYVDAPDSGALEAELPIMTGAALRAYEKTGSVVTGSSSVRGAPELAPGQYVDKINSGETRYYAVPVPDSMTLHASATEIRPVAEGVGGTDAGYLDLQVTNSAGDRCADDRQVDSDSTWNAQNTVNVNFVSTSDKSCFAHDGRYLLRVERGSSERSLGERNVELLVVLEPPVEQDHGQSPVGSIEFTQPAGAPTRVVGNGSFTHATLLAREGVYVDRLGFGEAVFFRVPLDWGQALAYQVRIGASRTPATANVRTQLFNPVRDTEFRGGVETTAYTGGETALGAISTPRIYHGNRATRGSTAMAGIAGDYYIVVQLNPDRRGADAAAVEFELALRIDGESVAPPAYGAVGRHPREPVFTPGAPAVRPLDGQPATVDGAVEGTVGVPWAIGTTVLLAAAALVSTWLLRRRREARD